MLGAEFLAATGGDLEAFGSVDRLAASAGLAPVPRDSGARQRQHASSPPRPAAGLLPLCHGQSQIVCRLEDVLRAQAQ
ncbi:transposase [Streptomyces sp. NPDC056479]|uniref:transposase n=1 Tax=Streptomyces sp. NPDC056479 TaxID=3345832 RepID=UPI0036C8862C